MTTLPLAKREKPLCTCGHGYAMHKLGPCALYKGKGVPDSCWCSEYDPMDYEQGNFPVIPLEQPDDE